jgi:hypothetical protein
MDQPACFSIVLGGLVEVGAHPTSEVDGFADVNYFVLGIFVQVDARFCRYRFEDSLSLFRGHHFVSATFIHDIFQVYKKVFFHNISTSCKI